MAQKYLYSFTEPEVTYMVIRKIVKAEGFGPSWLERHPLLQGLINVHCTVTEPTRPLWDSETVPITGSVMYFSDGGLLFGLNI